MVFSFIASLADCPLLSSIVLLGKNFEGPLASLSLSSSFLHRPWVIDLNSLRELSIGSATVGSFSNTKQLDLDGLAWANHLETLILGDNLFSGLDSFSIRNIKVLTTLELGASFAANCSSFTLEELPNLRSISLRKGALQKVPGLHLSNFPQLSSIRIEELALEHGEEFVANNNPELTSIEIGDSCFRKGKAFLLTNINKLSTLLVGSLGASQEATSFSEVQNLAIQGDDHVEEWECRSSRSSVDTDRESCIHEHSFACTLQYAMSDSVNGN